MELYSVLQKLREIEANDPTVTGSNTISNLEDLAITEEMSDKQKKYFGKKSDKADDSDASDEDDEANEKIDEAKGKWKADGYERGAYIAKQDKDGEGTSHRFPVKDLSSDASMKEAQQKRNAFVKAENKKLNEANVTISIDDLQSTDMESLSQMLHLAGVADTGGMGMDDVYSPADDMGMDDPMGGDDLGMDPMAPDMGANIAGGPVPGDELGSSDMDSLNTEPDMEMEPDLEPEMPTDDYEGGFDAEMGDETGMDMEPMDEPVVDMSPEEDGVVMGDYAEESLEDMLRLSGVEQVQEKDDDNEWENEPDPRVRSRIPGAGPNRAHHRGDGARPGDNPMAVTERTNTLKAKLQAFKRNA